MDFIIRVYISVNGLGEEESLPDLAKVMREGYIQSPSWVEQPRVTSVRSLKCFEAVREMLLNGMPAMEVARQIHLLNEMKSYTIETVRVNVEHFKATLPKMDLLKRFVPNYHIAQRRVDKTINAVEVLDEMINLMVQRIHIGMKKEIALEFLMPGMEKQFTVIKDLLIVQHEIKRDLGHKPDIEVGNPSEERIDWSKIYSAPNVNETMSNPEKRARLVRMTENITKLYGSMTGDKQQRILDLAKKKLEQRHE